jgi:hypothetical protein
MADDDNRSEGGQPGAPSSGERRYPEDFRPAGMRVRSRHPTDVWPAAPSFGLLFGIALAVLLLALALLGLLQGRASSGGARAGWLLAFVAAIAAFAATLWLVQGLRSIRYVFAGDDLVVQWMRRRRVVPLRHVLEVRYEPHLPVRLRGWEPIWPGYYVSTTATPDGIWRSIATLAPHRRVRIVTPAALVAISPDRPILFLAELERRRQALGASMEGDAAGARLQFEIAREDADRPSAVPVTPVTARVSARGRGMGVDRRWTYAWRNLFRERLLGDQVSSALIATGVVLPILMAGYLFNQYEALPDVVPLHWDANGEIDRTGPPRSLWILPTIAVLMLVVNTTLAAAIVVLDRFLARLLTATTPVAQTIVLIALIRAVS